MKIAILAWGSLIWAPKDLKINNEWASDGPTLPIEFSRVSRDGRLTLVIDEVYGTPVTTYWALSKFNEMSEAIKNLKKREGTNSKGIGFIDLINGPTETRIPPRLKSEIIDWAKSKQIQGVVWTDLKSNFLDKKKTNFSFDAAMEHLNSLNETGRKQADEYIAKAPAQTRTSFREHLQSQD